MLMIATVREVRASSLLVRDRSTSQDVLVRTNNARRFSVGDRVGILFNGVMTRSISPPFASAVFSAAAAAGSHGFRLANAGRKFLYFFYTSRFFPRPVDFILPI